MQIAVGNFHKLCLLILTDHQRVNVQSSSTAPVFGREGGGNWRPMKLPTRTSAGVCSLEAASSCPDDHVTIDGTAVVSPRTHMMGSRGSARERRDGRTSKYIVAAFNTVEMNVSDDEND